MTNTTQIQNLLNEVSNHIESRIKEGKTTVRHQATNACLIQQMVYLQERLAEEQRVANLGADRV